MLTKKPISLSISARSRFAAVVPTTISSCAEYRNNKVLKQRASHEESHASSLAQSFQLLYKMLTEKERLRRAAIRSESQAVADQWAVQAAAAHLQRFFPIAQFLLEHVALQWFVAATPRSLHTELVTPQAVIVPPRRMLRTA